MIKVTVNKLSKDYTVTVNDKKNIGIRESRQSSFYLFAIIIGRVLYSGYSHISQTVNQLTSTLDFCSLIILLQKIILNRIKIMKGGEMQ